MECTCYFDDVTFTQERNNSKLYKNNNKLLESAERYMEPEIIIKRMVGECSSSVTDSSVAMSWESPGTYFH